MFEPESALIPNITIHSAGRRLGKGALTEESLQEHIWPLFSRVLAAGSDEVYLANHSLGRPLDQTALDVQQALACWYEELNRAWEAWLTQREHFRAEVAALINAESADFVVPRANAGQGLRAVLNAFDQKVRVLASSSEFDSIDFILNVYEQRGRIELTTVQPDRRSHFTMESLVEAISDATDLIVISLVMFLTGQWLSDLSLLIDAAHEKGVAVLVDLYHAVGALPVNVQSLNADFAIGGCYKYLRGGPGAAWLYVHPRYLDGRFQTLDCGWYAQAEPFDFSRPPEPRFAPGGNAYLESTPAVLPFYQARAGLEFTRRINVERLRAYSLRQQELLVELLDHQGIKVFGAPSECGAFVAIPDPAAKEHVARLQRMGFRTDARAGFLRLCPDVLTTEKDLRSVAQCLGKIMQH